MSQQPYNPGYPQQPGPASQPQQPQYGQPQPPQYGQPQPPQQPQPPMGQPQPQPLQQPPQPMAHLQPQYGQPQQPQYGQPQQFQQPMAPPVAVGPPTLYQMDDAAALGEYKKAKESLGSGGRSNFLVFPGPGGQPKWDGSVPVGHEGMIRVHICGPWAEDKSIYVMDRYHFYRSHAHPQGMGIGHVDGCLFCEACRQAPAHLGEIAKDAGKIKYRYLYNVCSIDNVAAHTGEDGQPRSLILQASKTLHSAIGDVFSAAGGPTAIVDYQNGRPVRLMKKKTGPRNMDIQWRAMPELERAPLAQEFWPVASNLADLDKLVKTPTREDVVAAITELGLPVPVSTTQAQVPASYQFGTNPPHPSPYPPGVPQQAPLPHTAPPQQPMAPPQQAPQMPVPPPMNMTQPVMHPSQSMPAPPPVMSAASSPSGYQPQPSQPGGSVAQPPPNSAPVAMVPQGEAIQTLVLPLAAGISLAGERERCFGQFNAGDRTCVECPSWIKSQCLPQTPGQSAAPAQPQEAAQLNQLQNQLAGK